MPVRFPLNAIHVPEAAPEHLVIAVPFQHSTTWVPTRVWSLAFAAERLPAAILDDDRVAPRGVRDRASSMPSSWSRERGSRVGSWRRRTPRGRVPRCTRTGAAWPHPRDGSARSLPSRSPVRGRRTRAASAGGRVQAGAMVRYARQLRRAAPRAAPAMAVQDVVGLPVPARRSRRGGRRSGGGTSARATRSGRRSPRP